MTVQRQLELTKINENCDNIDTNDCWLNNCCNSILKDLNANCPISDKKDNNDNDKCKISRKLLNYNEAPEYMKHNCYILTGYRGILHTKLCIESIFWWTNETINIWSHLFGFLLFVLIAIRDAYELKIQTRFGDKFLVACVLICFQACMLLSSLYHTFSCRSEYDCDLFLSFDLFGIALSLLAIYVSGIYYAFWCDSDLLNFYLITVTLIFMIAMVLQIPRLKIHSSIKQTVFVCWAIYGIIPTVHWAIIKGGFNHPLVRLLVPRVIGMYIISGTAFIIYLTKIPERFYRGRFDYFGHSHQWWHLLVVWAFVYWHNSGMIYLNYRHNHACPTQMTII